MNTVHAMLPEERPHDAVETDLHVMQQPRSPDCIAVHMNAMQSIASGESDLSACESVLGSTCHKADASDSSSDSPRFDVHLLSSTDDSDQTCDSSDAEPVAAASCQDVKQDIAERATKYGVPHAGLSELLGVLQKHGMTIRKDPRTLLGTPTELCAQDKAGGKYLYLGVAKSVCHILCQHLKGDNTISTVTMDINIDGLQLFKSSGLARLFLD